MCRYLTALLLAALLLFTLGTEAHGPSTVSTKLPLRSGLSTSDRVSANINQTNLAQALTMYSELTGRTQLPRSWTISQRLDAFCGGYLSHWHIVKRPAQIWSGIEYHRDGLFAVGEVKEQLEKLLASNGLVIVPDGRKYFRVIRPSKP